ncbi:MAG TPA: diguanylate cyclase [Terracidiphilus sp.]|nr:diguanylate cyclase [Terracidiphilus sp.]
MIWTRIPDLICAVFMLWAFGSVPRSKQKYVSGIWMAGWVMMLIHSIAAMFTQLRGIWGGPIYIVYSVALIWAGLLFSHASIPHRDKRTSRWLLGTIEAASLVYMTILCLSPGRHWAMNFAAALITICPLAVVLASFRSVIERQHWIVLAFCASLSIFLLTVQNQHPYGRQLAWSGFLFTVYVGSCFFTFWNNRRATAGVSVTVFGFLGMALVFVLEPLQRAFWSQIYIESEVWHLPAFVVAMGMLLLLLEDELQHSKYLALHDELTGLANRRLFQDRLDNALARARRTGALLGLLSIDLNGFKQVNDALGHQAGDIVLQQVSAWIAGRIRGSDTVARTGGDEFSVILENPISRADAEKVGHSLRCLLKEPIQLVDYSISVGASVGTAMFPDDAHDVDSLCRVADLRMYQDKHGRDGPEAHAVPSVTGPSPAINALTA